MINADGLLMFNNERYYLNVVLNAGLTGPVVKISADEINDPALETYKVRVESRTIMIDDQQLIFIKQHGRYTILSGWNELNRQTAAPNFVNTITGHLLSSMALKKAKFG